MKLAAYIFFSLCSLVLVVRSYGQGFGCTADLYLSTHTTGDQRSKLYEILIDDGRVSMREIPLLSDVVIAGIAFNTQDGHIWALNIADQSTLIRIDVMGQVEHMADIPLRPDLVYRSGMLSPDGASYYTIGYDMDYQRAQVFYEIEISNDYYVLSDDISFSGQSDMGDLCVDPLSGAVYGYENGSGRIVQFGIDGQFSVVSPRRDNSENVDALFFDQQGQYYGYSRSGKLLKINVLTGEVNSIYQGPMASFVDGCSCPYRSEFSKRIEQEYLTGCQNFEVEYEFVNHLGSSYTGITLRDTFPLGFEIVDISSNAVFTLPEDQQPSHILQINNIVFQTGINRFKVMIQPARDYHGYFSSQADLCCFPQYPQRHLMSMDSDGLNQAAGATVLGDEEEFSIEDLISFNCDGLSALLTAPIPNMEYRWDGVIGERVKHVSKVGEYHLEMSSDCYYRRDTFSIDELPGPAELILPKDTTVRFNDVLILSPRLTRGGLISIEWEYDGEPISPEQIEDQFFFKPVSPGRLVAIATDQNGCQWQSDMWIDLEYEGDIYVPTVFSPNSDQINDLFRPFAPFPQRYDLAIYDKWGSMIYKQLGCDFLDDSCYWDGSIGKIAADIGQYIWELTLYENGSISEHKTGSFLLAK